MTRAATLTFFAGCIVAGLLLGLLGAYVPREDAALVAARECRDACVGAADFRPQPYAGSIWDGKTCSCVLRPAIVDALPGMRLVPEGKP